MKVKLTILIAITVAICFVGYKTCKVMKVQSQAVTDSGTKAMERSPDLAKFFKDN